MCGRDGGFVRGGGGRKEWRWLFARVFGLRVGVGLSMLMGRSLKRKGGRERVGGCPWTGRPCVRPGKSISAHFYRERGISA